VAVYFKNILQVSKLRCSAQTAKHQKDFY